MIVTQCANKYVKKVIIFGDSNTGKSSILNRLKYNTFAPDVRKTIGVNFAEKLIFYNNIGYTLQIWDFSGENRFLDLVQLWLKGTQSGICCFDVCNQDSFDAISGWINLINSYAGCTLPMILVGNKIDKVDERVISYDQGRREAENHGIKYYETSAKCNGNISNIFNDILNAIMKQ